MWDYAPPPKPFYRRAWFFVPAGLCLFIVLAGGVWILAEKNRWEHRARSFDYTQLDEMESASVMYDRSGNVFGRLYIQNRDKVPFEDLAPALITAVVAAEDARFYSTTVSITSGLFAPW
jgi:penicillin-binding protein 1A